MVHFGDAAAKKSQRRLVKGKGEESIPILPVTLAAVMCSWGLHSLAFLAPTARLLRIFSFFTILRIPVPQIFWQPPWIYSAGSLIRPPYTGDEGIEPYCLFSSKGSWLQVIEEILRAVGEEGYEDAHGWNSELPERWKVEWKHRHMDIAVVVREGEEGVVNSRGRRAMAMELSALSQG